MKTRAVRLNSVLLAVLTLGIGLLAGSAWAGPQIFFTTPVSGTYLDVAPRGSQAFVIQVFAVNGTCLRIEATASADDLEAVLVSPSGTVWRDDDGGAGTLFLIKANPVPIRGWYTLNVNHFSTTAVNNDFTMTIQNLATGNALCAPATPTLTPSQSPEKAAKLGQNAAAGQADDEAE